MNKKVLVVAVDIPKIAHAPGTYEVTVVYGKKQFTGLNESFVKKVKRKVFCSFKPEIGQWIEACFV